MDVKDALFLIAGSVLMTVIIIGSFGRTLHRFEVALATWFSRVSQQPRWFSLWIVVFPLYIIASHLLNVYCHSWYTDKVDNDVLAFLFSAMPYYLENAIKFSQAVQMQALTDLTLSIKEALDRGKERDDKMLDMLAHQEVRDEAIFALLQRIADAIEEGGESR